MRTSCTNHISVFDNTSLVKGHQNLPPPSNLKTLSAYLHDPGESSPYLGVLDEGFSVGSFTRNLKMIVKYLGQGAGAAGEVHRRKLLLDDPNQKPITAKNIQSCFSVESFPALNRYQKKYCFGLDYSDLPECCCKLFMVSVLFGQC